MITDRRQFLFATISGLISGRTCNAQPKEEFDIYVMNDGRECLRHTLRYTQESIDYINEKRETNIRLNTTRPYVLLKADVRYDYVDNRTQERGSLTVPLHFTYPNPTYMTENSSLLMKHEIISDLNLISMDARIYISPGNHIVSLPSEAYFNEQTNILA